MAAYQSRNQAFSEGVNGGPAVQANPSFHAEGPLMVGNQFHAQNGEAASYYGYTEPYDSYMIGQSKGGGPGGQSR